jgi:hypothetical protein
MFVLIESSRRRYDSSLLQDIPNSQMQAWTKVEIDDGQFQPPLCIIISPILNQTHQTIATNC